MLSDILFAWGSLPSCVHTAQHKPTSQHLTLTRPELWEEITAPEHLVHSQMTISNQTNCPLSPRTSLFQFHMHLLLCLLEKANTYSTSLKCQEEQLNSIWLTPAILQVSRFIQNQIPSEFQPQAASGSQASLCSLLNAWNTDQFCFSMCLKGTRFQGSFRLNIRKRLFPQRVVGCWTGFLGRWSQHHAWQSSTNFWAMLSVTWWDSWGILWRDRNWTLVILVGLFQPRVFYESAIPRWRPFLKFKLQQKRTATTWQPSFQEVNIQHRLNIAMR